MNERLAGRYWVNSVIGVGAIGRVWRAYDEVLQRDVALKELRNPTADPTVLHELVAEARTAAQINDPAVVTIHDVVDDGDRVLIAMELLEGSTLGHILRTAGSLNAASARAVAERIADGLAAAHARGIVHRDIKPENVFWLPSGRVVVTDFGLARPTASAVSERGTIMGTPGYMAPEQLRGDAVAPATDVFSWGTVMYEAIAGAPPFGSSLNADLATITQRVTHEQPDALDVPDDPALAAVVMAALRKRIEDRPRDGRHLAAMLRGATPIPVVRERTPVFTRTRVAVGLLTAMALAAAFIGGRAQLIDGPGKPVRAEHVENREALPTAPDLTGLDDTADSKPTFYRVSSAECAPIRSDAATDAAELHCTPPGSLLFGDGENKKVGDATWIHVLESVTGRWGWAAPGFLTPD